MNIIKKVAIGITLFTAIITFNLMGNAAFAQDSGRRHQGPPPEENLWGMRPSLKARMGIR